MGTWGRLAALAAVTSLALLAAGPPPETAVDTQATDRELPNLVPQPPSDLKVGRADDRGDGTALRFAITTQNLGVGHLDLLGTTPRDTQRAVAQQCVAWNSRVCLERVDVGDITFHPQHGHWHLDDYASYGLHRLRPDGTPDLSPEGMVVDGGKVSFCLIDTDRVGDPRADDPFGGTGFYTGCLGAVQGISVGWADTYGATLVGQQLLVDGVPAGTYAVVATVDPLDLLLETDDTDNIAWTLVELPWRTMGNRHR